MLPMKFKRTFALGFVAIVALSGFAAVANAQRNVAPPPQLRPLGEVPGVYWAQGGAVGANTGYVIGDNGVIMFDAFEFGSTVRDVMGELAKITPNPVTHFIFSHSNPDHFKGIFGYRRGLTIICQENTAKSIEAMLHFQRDAERVHFQATYTVDSRADLKIHGVNITLFHWAPAHTDGDLIAYLPDHKVAFVGDLASGTNVHLEDYGSTAGTIESLKQALALDANTYLGGHSDPLTKAQLRKVMTDMEGKRTKIVQLFEAGKSLHEAEVEMGDVTPPSEPGVRQSLRQMFDRDLPEIPDLTIFKPFRGMSFTEIVYTELTWEREQP